MNLCEGLFSHFVSFPGFYQWCDAKPGQWNQNGGSNGEKRGNLTYTEEQIFLYSAFSSTEDIDYTHFFDLPSVPKSPE